MDYLALTVMGGDMGKDRGRVTVVMGLVALLWGCGGSALQDRAGSQTLHRSAFEIPIIDAHSQVDQNVDLQTVIRLMDRGGVARTILSARGKRKPEELVAFAAEYPGRIIPAVRTKGQSYQANDPQYYRLLKKQLRMGHFRAMAEVLMYHAQKGRKAPEVVVYPEDRRVRAALLYALQHRWPFVVHIEFAAAGNLRDEFMWKLTLLLTGYPKHPFVLIHMGQLDHRTIRHLIEAHRNIFFVTSHADPVTVNRSHQPWTNLFDGDGLAPAWRALIIQHPDRFILGFDNVFAEHWGQFYLDQVALWRRAIRELPVDVAHALAHGNAERLWHLPPLKERF